jgi:hypothetical protein
MSMIRDLRAAVRPSERVARSVRIRPSRRGAATLAQLDPAALAVPDAPSAVVDCGVYRGRAPRRRRRRHEAAGGDARGPA